MGVWIVTKMHFSNILVMTKKLGVFGLLPKNIPYQFFGHDQKIGSCLDNCQLFGLPMLHY
jgi:hypothetical protein